MKEVNARVMLDIQVKVEHLQEPLSCFLISREVTEVYTKGIYPVTKTINSLL